jgi:hypothetical protein
VIDSPLRLGSSVARFAGSPIHHSFSQDLAWLHAFARYAGRLETTTLHRINAQKGSILIVSTLGDYQSDVVVLLVRAELSNVVNNRRHQRL